MKPKRIVPIQSLRGEPRIPGDKSISHRAVMLGAIAEGSTRIRNLLDCDDCGYTIHAFRRMGIRIEKEDGVTVVEGKGPKGLKRPNEALYLGESGTSMRLLAGILSGQDFEVTLEGASSLSRRPMKRVAEPLSLMGVDIRTASDGCPPLKIKGGSLKPINYNMPIPSAQVKSAILLAALYAFGITTIEESFKSRDHTERMLGYFGAKIKTEGTRVSLEGPCRALSAKDIEVPGDISSASFFIAAAVLLAGSKITLRGIGVNPTRTGILKVLSDMGSAVKITNKIDTFEPVSDIEARSGALKGVVISKDAVPSLIDELPLLFVLGCFAKGRTVIKGIQELKVKETDRIASMKENLERMGARIIFSGNDVAIEGAAGLRGSSLKSFGDHRTCMAITIAALAAKGESVIDDSDCVNKSFPGFFSTLDRLQ